MDTRHKQMGENLKQTQCLREMALLHALASLGAPSYILHLEDAEGTGTWDDLLTAVLGCSACPAVTVNLNLQKEKQMDD